MRLKALRQNKGITQEQLADKIGVTNAAVSRYEQSATYPSVDVLIKLCKFFGVSSDYLLGLADEVEFRISPLKDSQIAVILGAITEFEKSNALENPAE